MFWRVDLASCWRLTSVAKNACLANTGGVFKIFFSFPLNFSCLFTFSLNCSYLNTPCHSLQTPLLHLFTSKSSKKRFRLLFSHLISLILIIISVSICVGVFDFCYGFVSVFLGLFLFGLCKKLFPCKFLFSCWFNICSSICHLKII